MTKKHFNEAARIVRVDMVAFSAEQRATVADRYAQLFEQFNPRFDRRRFFTACGL